MRHGKKDNHLSRTHSHREAMLSNMAASLILHKRIETTLAKAKELRKYVEPILTRAKDDTYQNRRIVFRTLNNKETMKELFGNVADKIADRPGGYTRIIKLGNRAGDNAETCLMELVDFNEVLLTAAPEKATRTRRSRRGGGRKASEGGAETAAPVAAAATPAAEAPAAEVVADEPAAADAAAADAAVVDTPTDAQPTAEAAPEAPAADETTNTDDTTDESKQG
ncbi:hypothetical protein GCM10023187_27530 [Nibrella viscosa]|uniref:Large ribosomal subunit protein bL17 n=1 Tax=Nibrella viscosa TaxID=1084524 RepID=A0ABP8KHL9_9BACT